MNTKLQTTKIFEGVVAVLPAPEHEMREPYSKK